MIFDKTKAMRNAERYLAQGKIRLAIGEYKQVIGRDPKDFATMNMLGDLYVKDSAKNEAVRCYTSVAEHYGKQGFAQKAIAIYNKISKLQPGSIEIIQKLAELYKLKGSVTEARSHYLTLAEHHQKNGRKIEALNVWKQIALLDPNNTDVYLSLGESYTEEKQEDDAAESFTEAGLRFAKQGNNEKAVETLLRALAIKPCEPKTLAAFVESSFAAGRASEAAQKLAEILETNPHDRDILYLLIDCQIENGDKAEAERSVIKLVEQEPANYPKFLELAKIYLRDAEVDSATRILSMSSEHLLVGGQADEFHEMVTQILDQDPEQIDALRLLARYCSWQRDEAAFRESLEKLAGAANRAGSADDERFALSQLVMIVPHEVEYSKRLSEINYEHGYDEQDVAESLFDKQFLKANPADTAAEFDSFAVVSKDAGSAEGVQVVSNGFADYAADFAIVSDANSKESKDDFDAMAASFESHSQTEAIEAGASEIPETVEIRLLREIDSIKFYIENGYTELAEKAVGELRGEYGDRDEIRELNKYLLSFTESTPETVEAAAEVEIVNNIADKGFEFDDLRSELGLEESEPVDDTDYDTHYHTAVAYQEMGLLEDAIKEFQEAVGLVSPGDGTRRFFQCANLLGHCFMQKGMPNLALTWYRRTLETPGLCDEEKQGLWYELASAYEAEGDIENAGRYFEQVYAENIDFRDVSERVKNMAVNH